ncbi:MAG: glutathione S-transferase C-terminal domain-containing protein [Roseitalea sp.]|jgi:putative glutathione S-transferase|nr:glutathione S-transferase C-terminal domain-containing protein [Roseitalea sp.]MBO6722323.1 glutathione S-transferase C-terminal domain-containing protein [Roseitalea sp.]MBO6742347.1 glutathione S-transferase C-terminal domain-containing protein [Roseitalea sp.]
MGMLIEGRWDDEADRTMVDGRYMRAGSTFDGPIDAAVTDAIAAGAGRHVLVASNSCPWSHRTTLVRAVTGLADRLPLHIAGGPRVEGYGLLAEGPLNAGREAPLRHMHQLYTLTDPAYTGRVTVPVLWDANEERIVSNDSATIMRALGSIASDDGLVLVPAGLESEIDALNETIHHGLANAVYEAGKAQAQDAYDEAVGRVFATLSMLDKRLTDRRYLFGDALTETDLRLFATLVRFDAVYATHFRCTRHRLTDCANLWPYARTIHHLPGVAETVDFDAILYGYYANDGVHNPFGIVAERPAVDWSAPAQRPAGS